MSSFLDTGYLVRALDMLEVVTEQISKQQNFALKTDLAGIESQVSLLPGVTVSFILYPITTVIQEVVGGGEDPTPGMEGACGER